MATGETAASSGLQLGELLGEGGFAKVHKAQMGGKEVAVKVLKTSTLPGKVQQVFLEEAEIHKTCNSPQIVQLLDVDTRPEHYALILEYLPNGSLYDALHSSEEELPWETCEQIAIDCGEGLGYLHSKDICHRDLKSGNVLLDAQMRAKLSDFGQATLKTHTQTTTGTSNKGTVRWRAPETFQRKYKYVSSADVYSLAVVMWELVSKAVPYADESNDTVIMGYIKDGDTEDIPQTCPETYGELIQKAWQKDPSKRPPAEEITSALQQAQQKKAPQNKSWHFSDSYRHSPSQDGFELFPPGESDLRKVFEIYNKIPIPGFVIKRVTVIHNPDLNRKFAAQLKLLNARQDSPAFAPTYTQERYQETRKAIIAWQHQQSNPYQDPDAPHVQVQPVWHGMPEEVFASVCKTGYANLATTDDGFFGKGLYNTYEPRYAYECYATVHGMRKGTLVLNWVATHSSYPVVDGDMGKLQGKGNYKNYDAHLVPVKPRTNNPKEMNYIPCKPEDSTTYHELVVFDNASCLPRYKVDVGAPDGPQPALSSQMLPPSPDFETGNQLYQQGKYKEALPYLQKAAEAKHPFSFVLLLLLHKNRSVKLSTEQVDQYKEELSANISKIASLAADSHAVAQCNLGECYSNGWGVKKDGREAARLFKLAADQGLAQAQNYLGVRYVNGRGTPKDEREAARLFKLAADQGLAQAQNNLGLCYANGKGAPKDEREAVRLYKLAAEQGLASAQNNLGLCYANGKGVTKNEREAVRLYKLAAEQGLARAQYNLGVRYESGEGAPEDEREAVRLFKLAADQGLAQAQNNLGVRYENGRGAPKDEREAVRLYKLAAEQGYALAQCGLGWCYEYGKGVAQDQREAVRLFKLAADQGLAVAQCGLGLCYEDGKGAPKDEKEAVRLYKLAADQGLAVAQANLERLLENG